MAEKAILRREDLGYVAHGSDAHRALIGIDKPGIDPIQKANLQAALDAGLPPVHPHNHKPITRKNYKPRTRRNEGDDILDGWRRLQR